MSIQEKRLAASGNIVTTHAFLALDIEGGTVEESNGAICYYDITPVNLTQAEHIFLYFPLVEGDRFKKVYHWCNWVINDSQYKDAFITKSVVVGLYTGFELNTHADRAMMYGGMFSLRHAFEHIGWSWYDFLLMGMTSVEAYAMATHYSLESGKLDRLYGMADHFLIKKMSPFSAFAGEGYVPYGETMAGGFNKSCYSLSADHWGSSAKAHPSKLPLFPEDNLDSSVSKALKFLKEL